MILRAFCVSGQTQKKTVRIWPSERFMLSLENMDSGAPSGTRTRDTLIKSQVRTSRGRQ